MSCRKRRLVQLLDGNDEVARSVYGTPHLSSASCAIKDEYGLRLHRVRHLQDLKSAERIMIDFSRANHVTCVINEETACSLVDPGPFSVCLKVATSVEYVMYTLVRTSR